MKFKNLKFGRKPKYNLEDMQRFVNDYENHNLDYMIKKYNEVSDKAVQNKVYRFRKIINNRRKINGKFRRIKKEI